MIKTSVIKIGTRESTATAGSSVAKEHFSAELEVISISYSYMPAEGCSEQSPMSECESCS